MVAQTPILSDSTTLQTQIQRDSSKGGQRLICVICGIRFNEVLQKIRTSVNLTYSRKQILRGATRRRITDNLPLLEGSDSTRSFSLQEDK